MRFKEAFENEEFRKAFMDYAEELSNPESRKQMEQELIQLEHQNGRNVVFMNPEPLFCVKIKSKEDGKIFVNICQNDLVDSARTKSSAPSAAQTVISGAVEWLLPHKFSPARKCTDKSGQLSTEHDVTFHPDTMRLADKSPEFKSIVIDAALESIQASFNYKFKRNEYRILQNVTCKSQPATLTVKREDLVVIPDNKSSKQPSKLSGPEIPAYRIVYRENVGIQSSNSNSTQEEDQLIVVKIDLPQVQSISSDLNVKVTPESHLTLTFRDIYNLDIKLPRVVCHEKANCKFLTDKRQLEVIVPVARRD